MSIYFCIFIATFSFIICFIYCYFIICLYFLLFSVNFIRAYDQFSTLCIGKRNHISGAATSVSRLDHFIVSNGTLFNQKFHPSALAGREGLEKFVALIRTFFDQKGMHMQFNVVDRETLLDAQKHPENYAHLVVRVAGYSALFTTLSRSLQDDIIRRTEQGF